MSPPLLHTLSNPLPTHYLHHAPKHYPNTHTLSPYEGKTIYDSSVTSPYIATQSQAQSNPRTEYISYIFSDPDNHTAYINGASYVSIDAPAHPIFVSSNATPHTKTAPTAPSSQNGAIAISNAYASHAATDHDDVNNLSMIGNHPKIKKRIDVLKAQFEKECNRPLDQTWLSSVAEQRETIHEKKMMGGLQHKLAATQAYSALSARFLEVMNTCGDKRTPAQDARRIQAYWALSGLLHIPFQLLRLPLQSGLVLGNTALQGTTAALARIGLWGGRWTGIKMAQLKAEPMMNTWVDLLSKGRPEPASHLTGDMDVHQTAMRANILLHLVSQVQTIYGNDSDIIPALFSSALTTQHQQYRESVANTQLQWIRQGVSTPIDASKYLTDVIVAGLDVGTLGILTALIHTLSSPVEEWTKSRFCHHINTKYLASEALENPAYLRALNPLPAQLRVAYIEHAAKTQLVELNWQIGQQGKQIIQLSEVLAQPTTNHVKQTQLIHAKESELTHLKDWVAVLEKKCNKSQRVELDLLTQFESALQTLPRTTQSTALLAQWHLRKQALQEQLDMTLPIYTSMSTQLREFFSDGHFKVQKLKRAISECAATLQKLQADLLQLPKEGASLPQKIHNQYIQKLHQTTESTTTLQLKKSQLENDLFAFKKLDWAHIHINGLIGSMLKSELTLGWKAARAQAAQHHVSATAQYAESHRQTATHATTPYIITRGAQHIALDLAPYQLEHQEEEVDAFLRRTVEGIGKRAKRRFFHIVDGVRGGKYDYRIKQLIHTHPQQAIHL